MSFRRLLTASVFLIMGASSTAFAGDLDYPSNEYDSHYGRSYDHEHYGRRYNRSRDYCRRGWHDRGPSKCPYATFDEAWQACTYSNGQVVKAYKNGRFVGYICTDEGVTGG